MESKHQANGKHYDVVIVGGGPAGSSCAMALKSSRLKVALVDKRKFPRNKTCGDAIPVTSLRFLREIDESFEEAWEVFPEKQHVKSSKVYSSKGSSFSIDWVLKAYNSKRFDFDNFLLQRARETTDIDIIEGYDLKQIKEEGEQIKLIGKHENLSCSFVIGCDGANSIVKRDLLQYDGSHLPHSVAVTAYFSKVNCNLNENEFFVVGNKPGYFWIFPVSDSEYNVGYGVEKRVGRKTPNLKADFEEIIRSHKVIGPKFKGAKRLSKTIGHNLPSGGKKSPISGKRFVLCGDAANLIDPISGHGIDKAIKSGGLAAQHVMSCFEKRKFADNTAYDQTIQAHFFKELSTNYKRLVLSRNFIWLVNLLIPIMRINKRLFHKVYYLRKK